VNGVQLKIRTLKKEEKKKKKPAPDSAFQKLPGSTLS
jgi:hypothetical protein